MVRNARVVLLALVALVYAAMAAAPAPRPAVQGVALTVNDVSGAKERWPLVGGLPLPEGAVRDAAGIRVVDGQGKEVPAQVDVAATYRDGGIRWALLSLNASPGGRYRAEWGPGVRRAPVRGILLRREGEALHVDTGSARFLLSPANLLPDAAALAGKETIRLWGPGESAAYLVDNAGRRATCAGKGAEIALSVLKQGPLRCVVRTEGWYLTAQGEKVARGIARMTFYAGSPRVHLSHTLVFTEDTNKLWLRDYGLELPQRAGGPAQATFALQPAGAAGPSVPGRLGAGAGSDRAHLSHQPDWGGAPAPAPAAPAGPAPRAAPAAGAAAAAGLVQVALAGGQAAALLQDDYPHFVETRSHFALSLLEGGQARVLQEGEACGEWCDLSTPRAGLTVVLRDLAQQFPKELEVTPDSIRVHLWPQRCGREWVFRTPTLIRDYLGEWAKQGIWSQRGYVNRCEEMARMPGNALGCAKTHEVWLMPHAGPLDANRTVPAARAACRPPLLQADPGWVCASGAMTWPLHPRDDRRFPAEEAVLSDYFERTVLPNRAFPLTGILHWGAAPYLDYSRKINGRWAADFYRTGWSVEYGVRRHVWSLYARSGERRYFDYASRFNAFNADWEMAHWTGGDVVRGGFAYDYGKIHEPLLWRGPKTLLQIDNSGHDAIHWLFEYYFTGNERVLEASREYSDALKQGWDPDAAAKSYAQFVLLRVLSVLYTREWDPAFRRMADQLAERVIDLKQPNGLSLDLNRPYGPLYKTDRSGLALYDYWWATGSDVAKQAFLKVMDYEYRFNHIRPPVSYQNASAFLFAIAYRWTGRPEYLQVLQHQVRAGLDQEPRRLADELAAAPDLHALKQLPYRGAHTNMHYLLGMPTALAVLAEAKRPIPEWPLVDAGGYATEPLSVVLEKPAGKAAHLSVYVRRTRPELPVFQVTGPDGRPAQASVTQEERLPYRAWELGESAGKPTATPVHARVALPAGAPAGAYRVAVAGGEPFTVQDASVERVYLHAPEGFWLGQAVRAAYFRVPPEAREVRLYLTNPTLVRTPDGSVAVEAKDENTGEVVVPAVGKAGVWSLAPPARPTAPIPIRPHVKLLNVEPVIALAPGRLPAQTKMLPSPSPAPSPPGEPLAFVPGVMGQALHLSGGKSLAFPRGDRLPDGGYAHFPGREGTIELWFRPTWSSVWVPFGERQTVTRNFVRGGSVSLYYRYGAGAWQGNFYSFLDLLTPGALGRPGQTRQEPAGGQGWHFFQAGEWIHLAATWKIRDGARGTEGDFTVYLNGRKQERCWDYPRRLSGTEPFQLQEAAARILIGCAEGALDELRISRTPRYSGDFEPARQPFAPDAATAALFHFDGDTSGVAGSGEAIRAE